MTPVASIAATLVYRQLRKNPSVLRNHNLRRYYRAGFDGESLELDETSLEYGAYRAGREAAASGEDYPF